MQIFQSDETLNPQGVVAGLLADCAGQALPDGCTIRPARTTGQGDFTSNLALVLPSGGNATARDIAGSFAQQLNQDDRISGVQIGGQGFLNISATACTWQRYLKSVGPGAAPAPECTRTVCRPGPSDARLDLFLSAMGRIARTQGIVQTVVDQFDPPFGDVFCANRLDHHTIDGLRAHGVPDQHLRLVGEVVPQAEFDEIHQSLGSCAMGLSLLCGQIRKPLVLAKAELMRETLHNPAFALVHAQSQLARDQVRCAGSLAVPDWTAQERLIAAQVCEYASVLHRSDQGYSTDLLTAYLVHLARITHGWRGSWGRFTQQDPRNDGNSAPVLAKSSLLDAVMLVISTGICILSPECAS